MTTPELSARTAARIAAEYPAHLHDIVTDALASYGAEPHEREAERTRNAMLDLARGDAGELAWLWWAARKDYRDVLMWREAPASAQEAAQISERLGVADRQLTPVRYYKWGGRPHWRTDMTPLGEDEFGSWFGGAAGLRAQRGFQFEVTFPLPHVLLIPHEGWWTAAVNADEHEIVFYCDIVQPLAWRGESPAMIDLDLDVILRRDGTLFIDDEDEFEEHRVEYAYPSDVVERARATAAHLMNAIAAEAEPFGEVGARWMKRSTAR